MTRPLLLIICLVQAAWSFGQFTYGNEWIDHDRQYWRFEVFSTGLHRIDSAALAASGFPVGTVDPNDLMLFGRERQIPLFITGAEDGVLNGSDIIEFVGRINDGWVDTRMYTDPLHHANPYYSQFNDTIRYFLTWDTDPDVRKERVLPFNDPDVGSYPVTPWVWSRVLRPCTDAYYRGHTETNNVTSGLHLPGEGWGGPQLRTESADVQVNVVTNTPRAYTGPDAPLAEVGVTASAFSNAGSQVQPNHHLQVFSGAGANTLYIDTVFFGPIVVRGSFTMTTAELGNSFTTRFKVPHDLVGEGQIGFFTPNYLDWQAPSAITARYPRDLQINDAGPLDFWVPNMDGQSLARLDITNFTGTPVLYVMGDTMRRVTPGSVGGVWQALVPAHPDSTTTHTVLLGTEGARSISALAPVNGDGYFVDYGAMDPDSAFLIVSHRKLWNGAMAYANYRSGTAPAPRPTILADVDQLYDQFGGGVPKSSIAIRMWSKFVLDTWSTPPQGLFLIGKSVITSTSTIYGQGTRPDANGAYERCLVPTYGYPACDECFTIGLDLDQRRVDIPVGRLSATNDDQVTGYLTKVQELEAQAPGAWMKNIVHLSGGFNASEQNQLAGYLSQLEPQIDENTAFGGQVTAFRKSSSDIFATAAADSVRTLIESGVTIMNFFAHAYSENFDITIDDPDNYDWDGKYPLVMGNSCYIGNIHANADLFSTSENWVMRPGKGPIAFLSASDNGLAPYLAAYAYHFYASIGGSGYGKGIGEHIRNAIFQNLFNSNNLILTYTSHTMTLQGDPMLVLNSPEKPDLEVSAADLYFDPPVVNADVDTFSVKVVVRNIGRIVPDEFAVHLERTNTGFAAPQLKTIQVSNLGFQDTVVFRLPTLAFAGGQGVNQIRVRLDLDPDLIVEMEETLNNEASTTLFITSGDLVPTYPYDFAIVPDAAPPLKASTGDPLAPLRNYVFQIDTTDLFNSPIRETTMLAAPGGVVTWQPTSIYAATAGLDSMVYYWRCSIDSVGNGTGNYNWYERSFQYIPGKHGWGQAHYFQFKDDTYNGMVYDRPEREFEFSSAPHEISAITTGVLPYLPVNWRLDLVPQDFSGCSGVASWHVAVVDPYTFEAWGTKWIDTAPEPDVVYNPDHDFGNQNNLAQCRNRVMKYFAFKQNVPSQMTGLKNMINGIDDGYHLLFFTWFHLDKDGMQASDPDIISTLEALGTPSFSSLPDSVPYIFYVRKGFPETFQDTIGTPGVSQIQLNAEIESNGDFGFITTMEAGPSQAWEKLYWNELPYDDNDSTVIQIRGVTSSGTEVDLAEFPAAQDSVENLGSIVDAQLYPKVRIRGKFHDLGAADPKPSQLERWQLLHAPVPECAIDPQLGYFQGLDGWFAGQTASVAVAINNISEFDMDSLLVAAWVIDANNNKRLVHYRRNAPLPAGAFQLDTISFNTLGFGGPNSLVVEANPIDTITGFHDQPEQYHFNNIAQWRFDVTVDRENPLLDVTFDGIHILDGDIVSARPEIEISLNDENTVLILDSPADTAQFKVFLTRPGAPLERIFFRDGQGNENLQFIPADGPDNEARIFYRPNLPTDGKYTLTVQAADLSNNASGDNDYKVAFEVINRTTITEVLNYPNPFTTSTRFVFTLTGTEIPTYMKVQIMTITGKVVREVKMHELGPLRVGRNLTDFAWDGTDEFGDRLARGVYLYRVIAQMNGEDIEYRATDAASYFTKGFGKMYLLR